MSVLTSCERVCRDDRIPRWFKSSYSENGGNCVEIAADRWFKSSYSNNGGDCIEVAAVLVASRGVVPVRDSKDPDGPRLSVPATAFASFVAGVKADAFRA
ncbi:DUF397 domain-containing protein [Streptomyces benahoarensis]|uniref:DUF397 domain-containing protein n=1 Tax=Streptomyces benahoarensis TaxID=2595054 RepID=A0A553YZE9_9ACTN|nr:DUF397 domain-containing protein [Streptomyces benahoarensis]TSB17624.1 DUF397 domain-containing protein [Streptomyces benahoarensis]TSB34598.1 DUF397 domain-containing protein [Streptomyces benahoarensis]